MLLEREPESANSPEPRRDFAAALVEATPELRRIACYYVSNADSAEDVVQSTLLTAIEREATFDPRRPLVPWLAGILLNKVAALRRERHSRELEFEPDRLLGPSSEAVASSNEIERLVAEGLRQLPPKYREVLELYLRDGEQGAEIAARLQKPPGTIRAQIHRGLNRLRALLPASLALGTLVALFLGRSRASAAAAQRGVPPDARGTARGTPRGPARRSWMRTNPALSFTAGALALATGGIALSAGLGSERGARIGASTVATSTRDDVPAGQGAGGERRSLAPVDGAGLDLADPSAVDASQGSVALHVFDRRNRTPLGGVELAVVAETRDGERHELRAHTDGDGNTRLDLAPAALERLTVRTSHAGHAPHWSAWSSSATTFDGRALRIPLHGARPIGGLVVDESERPISGALVQAAITLLMDDELWITAPEEVVTRTDADGRWTLAEVPDAAGQIHLRIAHPEYVSELHYDDRRRPPPEELWASTSRIVLQRGKPLAVRVLDERGTPVENASVRLMERRDPPQIVIELATDEEGRVEFAAPDEDLYIVQVRAPGFLPSALFLERDAAAESEVRLRHGVPVALAILDADGLPAADARVRRFGFTWNEALGTDDAGRLEIEVAPGKSALISVRRPGIFGAAVTRVEANTREVRLPRPMRLAGVVLDATSGLPIEHSLLRVLRTDGIEIARLEHAGGSDFDFAFYPSGDAFVLEAAAVGFETERSAELPAGADLRLEPALPPAAALALQLVDAEGSPADYAGLALCRAGAEVTLERGCLFLPEGERKLFARGDGRLHMNRPEGDFALAIVGQYGFAFLRDTELPADGRIAMERWGRVEGRGEPGALIRLEPLGDHPGLAFDYTTRVDDRGRYQFRCVPGGLVRVHPEADPGRAVVVDVLPGQAAEVASP